MAQALFSTVRVREKTNGTRKLLGYTPNRVTDVASVAICGIDARRIEVQVVHTVAIVPRRRPVVTVGPLTARRTIAEEASERKLKGGLEGSSAISRGCDTITVGNKLFELTG